MARHSKHKRERIASSEEFDPEKMIGKAAEDFDPSILDGFDDSDVLRAKNIYQFCTSSKFMYAGTNPFPIQMKMMLELFEDYCPYCSNMKWWKALKVDTSLNNFEDEMTFLKFGKCKKCKKTRLDMVNDGYFTWKNELAGCAGMRSGKTAMAGWIASYQLHKFLCLKSPQQSYGLRPGSKLMMTFSALTAGQAKDTLWDSFTAAVDYAPWYLDYHRFLDEQGKRLGLELYNYQATKLDYMHKGLEAGFVGADFRTIKGRTRFYSSIDELGFFDSSNDGKVKANAKEIFTAFEKSLRTIRSKAYSKRKHGHFDIPTGLMVNISSPADINDAIMQRVRKSEQKKTIVAFHMATWEFNPDVTFDSLYEEAENPATFDRDYGAIPPLAADPFINDKQQIDKVFYHDSPPLFQTIHKEKVMKLYDKDQTYFWYELKAPFEELSVPRCVGVDTGESNNSYSVTVSHWDNIENKAVIDQVVELTPVNKMRVYFPGMLEDFLLKLQEQFWVLYYVFDQWNSIEVCQSLQSRGVRAEAYSLTYDDLLDYRKQLMADQIVFPKTEHSLSETKTSEIHEKFKVDPVAHMKLQLATVRDLGRRVVKPTNGTDDLFRSSALTIKYLQEHRDEFADYQAGVIPNLRGNGKKGVGGLVFAMRKQGGGGNMQRRGVATQQARPNIVRVHRGNFGGLAGMAKPQGTMGRR